MKQEVNTALQNSAVFSMFSLKDRQHIMTLLKPSLFQPDEIIFQQGEIGNRLYLIQSGRVKVCVLDPEGAELVFAFLSSGDIMGEMAVLDGGPRSATAVAVENTKTLYIERTDFLKFLESSPTASKAMISMLSKRLRETDKHLEELTFLDVAGRIARRLLETPNFTSPSDPGNKASYTWEIGQEELARMVGASRVMVNKVLNSFVDLKLITLGRKKLTILSQNGLDKIARFDKGLLNS